VADLKLYSPAVPVKRFINQLSIEIVLTLVAMCKIPIEKFHVEWPNEFFAYGKIEVGIFHSQRRIVTKVSFSLSRLPRPLRTRQRQPWVDSCP